MSKLELRLPNEIQKVSGLRSTFGEFCLLPSMFPNLDSPIGTTRCENHIVISVEVDSVNGHMMCFINEEINGTVGSTTLIYGSCFSANKVYQWVFRMEGDTTSRS